MNEQIDAWRRSQHIAALALMQVVNADWRARNKALANTWEADPSVLDVYARMAAR